MCIPDDRSTKVIRIEIKKGSIGQCFPLKEILSDLNQCRSIWYLCLSPYAAHRCVELQETERIAIKRSSETDTMIFFIRQYISLLLICRKFRHFHHNEQDI
jgi:hypothetical protein